MTLHEALAHHYPLHFQRICELIHETGPMELYKFLSQEDYGNCLAYAFAWEDSNEGHEYWRRLAMRERRQ